MGNLPVHIYGYNNEHDVIVTRSSRIRRVNVDSHAIVFKSLYFGPFTLKLELHLHRFFKLKPGLQESSKDSVFELWRFRRQCLNVSDNVKSYLSFNVQKFRIQCAMALRTC